MTAVLKHGKNGAIVESNTFFCPDHLKFMLWELVIIVPFLKQWNSVWVLLVSRKKKKKKILETVMADTDRQDFMGWLKHLNKKLQFSI